MTLFFSLFQKKPPEEVLHLFSWYWGMLHLLLILQIKVTHEGYRVLLGALWCLGWSNVLGWHEKASQFENSSGFGEQPQLNALRLYPWPYISKLLEIALGEGADQDFTPKASVMEYIEIVRTPKMNHLYMFITNAFKINEIIRHLAAIIPRLNPN